MMFKGQLYIPHFVYLFIYSWQLPFISIVNNAAIDLWMYKYLFQDAVSILLSICQKQVAGSSLDFSECMISVSSHFYSCFHLLE